MKTYSHLIHKKRIPTEYELVCSKLHYYVVNKGFGVNTPLAKWYEQYQKNSLLKCSDWEQFYDPRETTYSKYVNLQNVQETFINGVLEYIEHSEYDHSLSKQWLNLIAKLMFPFRYAGHGCQMIAAYIGQMASSGKITIACALQAADELRRVQRFAYRMRQLQIGHDFLQRDPDSKFIWEKDPIWQPLRECVETLLVTYDWAEALIVLNLVLKPMLDDLFMVQLGQLAAQEGDTLLSEFLFSLNKDCEWHQAWSHALIKVSINDNSKNRPVIERWISEWYPRAQRAVSSFVPVFKEFKLELRVVSADDIFSRLDENLAA